MISLLQKNIIGLYIFCRSENFHYFEIVQTASFAGYYLNSEAEMTLENAVELLVAIKGVDAGIRQS